MDYERIFHDSKNHKRKAHDWRPKRWRKVLHGLPRQGPVAQKIWCLTAPFAYFSPLIGYAAHSAATVREWDAYATADWRVPLAAGRCSSPRFQSRAWRGFHEYLRRHVPRHLRGEFIKTDGRFTNPHGMYVTCLYRMLPLFVFVWWTKIKVRGRGREAMEEYRSM
ncbi:hypothetical protein PG984_006773 [Apiospora sp. TS-2023a]